MSFRLLVFDWDGTLMDSAARIVACMQAAARDRGRVVPSDSAVRNIIGLGLDEAVHALFPDARDRGEVRTLAERYRHHFLGADTTPSELFPGAARGLRRLEQKGYLLAVATGKGRRGLDSALQATGLAALFHATRCADETFSKPHPAMLLELMSELGAAPHETLMIGDTEYDLAMAANAGTPALAVSYGAHEPERLLRHGPLGCVDSVAEIEAWLDGSAAGAAVHQYGERESA
jgi:phosphoglycolate phosphatase